MNAVDVDWDELELAFRDASVTECHLDVHTAEVIVLIEPDDPWHARIAERPERFVRIPGQTAQDARHTLTAYAAQARPRALGAALRAHLAAPGGYAAALALLRETRGAQAAYQRFEQEALWATIRAFLTAHGLRPRQGPPEPDLFGGAV